MAGFMVIYTYTIGMYNINLINMIFLNIHAATATSFYTVEYVRLV